MWHTTSLLRASVCVPIFVRGRLWSTLSVGRFCAQTSGSSYTWSFAADCIARLRVLVSKTRKVWVRLIWGNTSFDIRILKLYGSQLRVASEALWANFCSFLLCVTSNSGSVLWARFSGYFTGLWNSSRFADLLPTCVRIGKDAETAGGWIIYLFIHYKCFFDLAKCGELEKPFFVAHVTSYPPQESRRI